ncbi:MAG: hypothetical protein K2O70_05720, partial [Desulfovibrionaceae bacterium]|nr:hypothetical protein [Desulfovibrionaceae bacterium]
SIFNRDHIAQKRRSRREPNHKKARFRPDIPTTRISSYSGRARRPMASRRQQKRLRTGHASQQATGWALKKTRSHPDSFTEIALSAPGMHGKRDFIPILAGIRNVAHDAPQTKARPHPDTNIFITKIICYFI